MAYLTAVIVTTLSAHASVFKCNFSYLWHGWCVVWSFCICRASW